MSGHQHHGMGHGRQLKIAAVVTGAYFFFELAVGLYTGSVMVLVDAAHTFSAVGGVVLALVARRIARRPASLSQTFGGQRAEIVGALMNGAALLVMALVAMIMGGMRLMSPIEIPAAPMFIVALVGMLTEIWLIALMFRSQKEDINTRGAFWHVVQTFLGSFGIIFAAGVIHFTGFMLIDPILGMLFGLMVLYAAWSILRESLSVLMEHAPEEPSVSEICEYLNALDGVRHVHHPHLWLLTSGKPIFSAHLRVDESLNLDQLDALLKRAKTALGERFSIYFSTLQLELSELDESEVAEIDVTGTGRESP
ncbi:cobalt-zinc-cadmium efflux system protein [Natronospira proteinivora]|uniref:Cobalt-zinc-cadmium efflux system protein n=1 Tax=Natronospira proteinivora TaxID=1807133 RepID=A0ABT1G8B1_9GAMM|nr:cation diffusion facilitator family transporter [Natronospira proteinivora]MCP1727551.1 cobalt-zinc-cadmium efflux system protein [Natronospira proteinivora]